MERDERLVFSLNVWTACYPFLSTSDLQSFIGSKSEGFQGELPGVLEEALIALEIGQPIYLAGEPSTLDQPPRHFTKVASLPLLGLENFHQYLDRYPAKEQTRRDFPDTITCPSAFQPGCVAAGARNEGVYYVRQNDSILDTGNARCACFPAG